MRREEMTMRNPASRMTAAVLLSIAAVALAAVPVTAGEGLSTKYTVLVGHLDEGRGDEGRVLILPGTLIPDIEGPERLTDKIADAYRLKSVHAKTDLLKLMPLDEEIEMPSAIPDVAILMSLVGFNDSVATYRIKMMHEGKLLADTPVSVRRGGRAIVGSRDGEAAPYLFIVIGAAGVSDPAKAGAMPKVLERIAPRYPEEARKNKVQGKVIVIVTVGTDGRVRDAKIDKSPDPLLSNAALDAVEQWLYEPQLDEAGLPAEAEARVTIDFTLE
jgi:TonB family protein